MNDPQPTPPTNIPASAKAGITAPALAVPAPIRRRRWILFWSIIAAALCCLLAFDARLDTYLWCAMRWAVGDGAFYNWTAYRQAHAADAVPHFYMIDAPPMESQFYERTETFWNVCKLLGQGTAATVAALSIGIFTRGLRRLLAGGAAMGEALSGFAGWLIRSVDGRYRPTHTDATNHWELFRGFYNGTDLSFPSGHATLSFAMAAALSYAFPRGKPLFIAVAFLTALSRVVQEAHFCSDVLFGAALGWTVSWMCMHATQAWLAQYRPAKKRADSPAPPPANSSAKP